MGFLIYGRDSTEFGADDEHPVHEVHQTYMDQWAAQLVARGPTLSEDGSRHTGSVHVLDVPDSETARKFADDEPYAQAGWFSEVTVWPFESVIQGTMWDHPAPSADQESSFALASWIPTPRTADLVDSLQARFAGDGGPPWSFVGLLLSDDSAEIVGLAGSADRPAPAAATWLHEQLTALPLEPTDLTVHRWRRGGR
jgi:uncharacterized protein YciI